MTRDEIKNMAEKIREQLDSLTLKELIDDSFLQEELLNISITIGDFLQMINHKHRVQKPLSSNFKTPDGDYACKHCSERFGYYVNLIKHMKEAHSFNLR